MATVLICWCVGSFALAPLVGRAMRKAPPTVLEADDASLLLRPDLLPDGTLTTVA